MGAIKRDEEVRQGARLRRAFARGLIASGLVLLAASCAVPGLFNGIMQPAGVYIPHAQREFKVGEQSGGALKHTFRIYNMRLAKLALQAEPDCGCTHLSWQKATVWPFGWVDLETAMDAPKHRSTSRSVTIALKTNRAELPYTFVKLKV